MKNVDYSKTPYGSESAYLKSIDELKYIGKYNKKTFGKKDKRSIKRKAKQVLNSTES